MTTQSIYNFTFNPTGKGIDTHNTWFSESMEYHVPYNASSSYIYDNNAKKYTPFNEGWGKTINDTWLISQPLLTRDFYTASDGTTNTRYWDENNVVTHMIGDIEYISQSRYNVTCSGVALETGRTDCTSTNYYDATNHKHHKNRRFYKPEDYTNEYESLFPTSSRDGLMIGRTTYISESIDGNGFLTIHYPSNHYVNFHLVKDQLKYLIYERDDNTTAPQFDSTIDTEPTKWAYSKNIRSSATRNTLRTVKNKKGGGSKKY
tara:strand:- start:715 stop:1497 length:783 start_codon:yes stop_codon:yes gene_type:complete